MARKRMISPEIWESEDFGKLSVLAKLVFIGIFSNADDEGRGRGKSSYLKSIIFPYDENIRVADIDKTLSEISSNMSVILYEYNQSTYYELTNWKKWQKVDKPTPSKIPGFKENDDSYIHLFVEDSPKTLRTFSPNRIEKKEIKQEENRSKKNDVFEIYNRVCTNLTQCLKLTTKRETSITTFLKTYDKEKWEKICSKANNTPFLIGENDRNWKADIDFLLRIDKATSVLEGKYDNIKKIEKKQGYQSYEQRDYKDDNLDEFYEKF